MNALTHALSFDPACVPDEVRLDGRREALHLSWADGGRVRLPAERLRLSCRCAWCTRARAETRMPDAFPGIALTDVAMVADYALNLTFSDGHARGIYPFSYLLALAGEDLEPTP